MTRAAMMLKLSATVTVVPKCTSLGPWTHHARLALLKNTEDMLNIIDITKEVCHTTLQP